MRPKLLVGFLFFFLLFGISLSHAFPLEETAFCKGFERGYIAGYKKATGMGFDPFVPFCPYQPYKGIDDPDSDFEHGYLIGLEHGLEEGSR